MKCKFIILAGGRGNRLKPDIWTPKPFLDLGNGKFLLQHQIDWLVGKNISRKDIVVSTNKKIYDYMLNQDETLGVSWIVETSYLGTGGAIRRAIQEFPNINLFYVMNVDNLLFSGSFNAPSRLLKMPKNCLAHILTGFGRFPYGVVYTKSVGVRSLVVGFEPNPLIKDRPVSVGHVVFRRSTDDIHLLDYLPVIGDYENMCLPELVKMRLVFSLFFKGIWRTVNNVKELVAVKTYLREKNIFNQKNEVLATKLMLEERFRLMVPS